MGIFLLYFLGILVTLNSCNAKSILLEYPAEVTSGEVFLVNLTLINFTSGTHNIKIDIYNLTADAEHRLSEIYNSIDSEWKSTNFYINNIINTSVSNTSMFMLNITKNYNGTANITVKVDIATNSYDYQINILLPKITLSCTQNLTCTAWGTCSNGIQNRSCINQTAPCINITYLENQTCALPANNTQNTTTNPGNNQTELYIWWDIDKIKNKNEWNITLEARNLENKVYAVKIGLLFYNESESIISDRYDENQSKWKSSIYWVYDFFKGPGNQTKIVTLRLREDYTWFYGTARIFFKIKNATEIEITKTIEILNSADSNISSLSTIQNTISPQIENSSRNSSLDNQKIIVFKTNSDKNFNNEANRIIYKSKNEYIKEYAPYAFSILCIFLMVLIIIDRNKIKTE